MGASVSVFLSGIAGHHTSDVPKREAGSLSISEKSVEQDRIDSESYAVVHNHSDQLLCSNTSLSTNERAYATYSNSLSLRTSVEPDVSLLTIHNNEYFRLVNQIKYFLACSTFYGDPCSAFTDEILESLPRPPEVAMTLDQRYIKLQNLSNLLLDPDVFNIVRYLIQLAQALGLEELSTMHLEPYLYITHFHIL
jgi:hypothetical protein